MSMKRYAFICIVVHFFVVLNGFLLKNTSARIRIEPKIHTGFKNESNYWKTENNEVAVNSWFAKPGVTLSYEKPKLKAEFDGTIDLFWYDDEDTSYVGISDAGDDNYVGSTSIGSVQYQLTRRINIGFSDSFYVTRDPARADRNSNSIARDKYTYNVFEPKFYYEFADRFGLLTQYRNTDTNYEDNLEDSNENKGVFDLYYFLNRTSAVYLGYDLWHREYTENSSDYTSHFITINYEKEYSFFVLSAGGGYHTRIFDDSTIDDQDFFSWRVELEGMDEEKSRRTTSKFVNFSLGQAMNDDGTGDSYFIATFVDFEGSYRFFQHVGGLLKLGYRKSDYKTSDRDDDTYYGSLGIAYQPVDFLTIGVEGGLEKRDSSVEGKDYNNTYIMGRIDIDYDLSSR